MPTWTGSFNKAGSPTFNFKLGGPIKGSEQEFEGIIDTGFSGFVSMPIVKAFPLGLLLAGTTSVTLADGKISPQLVARGMATVSDQERIGLVLLQGSSADILLGMDFLTKFGRVLFIHPSKKVATLMDQKDVDPIIEEQEKLQAEMDAKAKSAAEAAPEAPAEPKPVKNNPSATN